MLQSLAELFDQRMLAHPNGNFRVFAANPGRCVYGFFNQPGHGPGVLGDGFCLIRGDVDIGLQLLQAGGNNNQAFF